MKKMFYYTLAAGLLSGMVVGEATAQTGVVTPLIQNGYVTDMNPPVALQMFNPTIPDDWSPKTFGDNDFPAWNPPDVSCEADADGTNMRSCDALGYLQSASECADQVLKLTCPFDDSRYFCGGKIDPDGCNIIERNNAIARANCDKVSQRFLVKTSNYCVSVEGVPVYQYNCLVDVNVQYDTMANSNFNINEAALIPAEGIE